MSSLQMLGTVVPMQPVHYAPEVCRERIKSGVDLNAGPGPSGTLFSSAWLAPEIDNRPYTSGFKNPKINPYDQHSSETGRY